MSAPLPRLHAITDERIARRADLKELARALSEGGRTDLAFHARANEVVDQRRTKSLFGDDEARTVVFDRRRIDVRHQTKEQ